MYGENVGLKLVVRVISLFQLSKTSTICLVFKDVACIQTDVVNVSIINFCVRNTFISQYRQNANWHLTIYNSWRHLNPSSIIDIFRPSFPCHLLLYERVAASLRIFAHPLTTSHLAILSYLFVAVSSHNTLKVYLYPKTIFRYVKRTQFKSPLHQHSEKRVHQVIK